jgi:N-acetylglutamate synthase-like GNAT family acetyltransferase
MFLGLFFCSLIHPARHLLFEIACVCLYPTNQPNKQTNSLLSRYRLCAAGIGLGTAYSLKYKKGLSPMIAAGAVGTTVDMVSEHL